MNLRGKNLEAIRAIWRARYGTNAPLSLRPYRVSVTRNYIVPAVDVENAVLTGLEAHPSLEQGEPKVTVRRV